ncbi:MAG: ABC transporter ATP-binding protein [Alphaproteobacteria bacterium]|nr:ABC transporter ATP-binding protein [Alphaproteobacteria bacterium]
MAAILELNDIAKRFGKLVAVKNISFDIPEGEIRGLIGPNGSGKTTIFHLISGFEKLTSGTVRFQGKNLKGKRPHQIAKLGLVRTFQLTSIYRELTVRDNVMTGHHLYSGRRGASAGASGKLPIFETVEESAAWILDFMELTEDADKPARLLPAGMQRVLSIATALAVRPTMLLLDEPLAGLDSTEKARISEKIKSLRDYGVTILLVEHDVRSVLSICDRITVIDFGQKIAEGTAEEVTSDPEVIEAYLGRPADYDA